MTTQTSTFQPTFLQKLLGRNYKWWYLFVYAFKSNTAYRWSSFSWLVSRLLTLLATILIWYVSSINGFELFDFKFIFTYYIVGTMFSINNTLLYGLADDIKSGKISRVLLLPSNSWLQMYIGNLGWNIFSISSEFLLVGILGVIGFKFLLLPANPLVFLLFLACNLLGYFILVLTNFLIGSLAFFITDIWGLIDLQSTFRVHLSGKTIPLNILPALLPLSFLPFAFTFYHPMQIYLGKYSALETLFVFLGGIAWCVILYFLAKLVFKMGLKRNESVGL
jgi:ABC-2 type transport system permease protein